MTNPCDSNAITRAYIDSLLIETRYIGAVLPDTSFTLYGQTFASPIMTSAFSHLDKIYKDAKGGMVEMAKGAFAAQAVMWAGMGDEEEMAAMAATGAKTIKIIKPYADEKLITQQIEEARRHGALAVGMDIDHGFNKSGQYDNVFGHEMRPKSVDDLKRYAQSTDLPFIVKGVLSVRDAEACAEAGVQGIVVSHHHGIIDSAVPPLKVLPEIAGAVGGQLHLFVDCGIETGLDAFKALALGATAVCVGRVIIQDLIREGCAGATGKLNKMKAELTEAMARTGSCDVAHIDSDLIWNR